ncbi:MAG: DUF6778 family protein [Pseudomonadota bacterium]
MPSRRLIATLAIAATFGVAACAPTISPIDFTNGAQSQTSDVANWALADIIVEVPEDMKVETDGSNRYPDPSLLVWYGDPPGDRKVQVATLLADAVVAGAVDALTGTRPVVFKLYVDQFHAMTPAARATNIQLGVHELRFDFEVVDAATGEVLAREDDVNADFRAFSGTQALLAERNGQDQKIRIQTRVSQVIREWLTS